MESHQHNRQNSDDFVQENAAQITGPLWGESIYRWIPLLKGIQCGFLIFSWLEAYAYVEQNSSYRWFETPWRQVIAHEIVVSWADANVPADLCWIG